jgi:predicted RNA-binding protein YlqC (UPF0109 family)
MQILKILMNHGESFAMDEIVATAHKLSREHDRMELTIASSANLGLDEVVLSISSLVESIAQALVDEPSFVRVGIISQEESATITLRVAPRDLGKIIGKQGRTAKALRTILAAASMKEHFRFSLDIQEIALA